MTVLLLFFAGCNGYVRQPLLRGSVTYSVSGNEVTIVACRTPYDRSHAERDAYLFGFKRGFEDALNGKLIFYHFERTRKGEAGEAGMVHGMDEGKVYIARMAIHTTRP